MDRSLNRLHAVDRERAAEPTAESDSSDPVEWRDISVEPDQVGGVDAVVGDVTDRIRTHAGDPLTIETGAVRATLVGVPEVRIDDLVYGHHRRRLGDPTRPCALFDVENTSSAPINWTTRRTKFIGTDGYTYNRAHISLDPAQLGAGCYPSQVEIEPGCRARVITPVEQLPGPVGVAKVVQTVAVRGRPTSQRLTYNL